MSTIITIGRQCGSGGHTIGKKVSKKLGIPFNDKEIIKEVAKERSFGGNKREKRRAFGNKQLSF